MKCGIAKPLLEYGVAYKKKNGEYSLKSRCKACTQEVNRVSKRKAKRVKKPKEEHVIDISFWTKGNYYLS